MTFDNQPTRTEIITLDVASLEADITFYPQGKTECDEQYSTSNSFIYEGFLYQVIFCDERMVFKILNLATGEQVKEFSVTKDEDIYFKASELHLSGSGSIYSDGERDLSKTKQFLRKVAATNALVSPVRTRQGIRVKLGGAIEMGQPSAGGTPGVAGSYMRSITFNTILSEPTFDYLKDVEIPEGIFANINTYKTELDEDAKTLTGGIIGAYVFIFDNTLVLGHFHRKNKEYILVGFPSP
jgi:hypothetical protein